MAVLPTFHRVQNPRAFAAHMLRATEPLAERDAQRAYQQDPDAVGLRGSVPVAQADMSSRVSEAIGLRPGQAVNREQLERVFAGKRADGADLPRAARSRRDVQVVVITAAPHISHSIGRALSKTAAAAALHDSALRGANADMMRAFEEGVGGWTRRGAQGKGGEEQGHIARIEVEHRTTRRTKDGLSKPMSHVENIVPNMVVTASGHVGAMNLRRMKGRLASLETVFQESLHRRMEAFGANVKMVDGVSVLADVPERLVAAWSRRTVEAEANAREYALAKGLVWDDLPKAAQTKLVKVGARVTQGSRYDGVADREAWTKEAATFSLEPRDFVDPARAQATALPAPAAAPRSLLEASSAVRRASAETMQKAMQVNEAARAAGQPAPTATQAARRHSLGTVLAESTAVMRAAVLKLAPPPSQQARQNLSALTAAVRQRTAAMLRPAARVVARQVGMEVNAWVQAYRLQGLIKAGKAVTRYVMAGGLAQHAAAVAHAAQDTARAAQAGAGAMRNAWASRRFARLAAAGNDALRHAGAAQPVAARQAAVATATAAAPESPLERRAREIREAAQGVAAKAPASRPPRMTKAEKKAAMYGPPVPASVVAFNATKTAFMKRDDIKVLRRGERERRWAEETPGVLAMLGQGPSPAVTPTVATSVTAGATPSVTAPVSLSVTDPVATGVTEPVTTPAGTAVVVPIRARDAILAAHGSPQAALNSYARLVGHRVARGDVSLSEAVFMTYDRWKKITDPKVVAGADVDQVMGAIEKRVVATAEDAYARQTQREGAALAPTVTFREVPMEAEESTQQPRARPGAGQQQSA